MNAYQNTIAKLNQLHEPMLQEVDDFIDSLLLQKHVQQDSNPITYDMNVREMMQLAETGFSEWNDPEEDIYNDAASTP